MELQALTPSLEHLLLDSPNPNPPKLELQLQSLTPSLEQLRLDSPNPNPNSNLGPLQCTSFKRKTTKAERKERRVQRKKEKREKKERERQLLLLVQQLQVSNPSGPLNPMIEWQIEPPPPPPPRAGWADPEPPPYRTATAEEKVKIAGVQLQRNAWECCRDYLSRKEASDDDLMEDDCDDDDERENETFRFLLGLLNGDRDLKRCYEKGGEFRCLVCVDKKFGDCVALIQHSATVSKTKMRAAHRAFGRALCCVLGLDVGRFGFIVSEDSLVQSMTKANLKDGSKEDNGVDQKNGDSMGTDEKEPTDCSVMTTLHWEFMCFSFL